MAASGASPNSDEIWLEELIDIERELASMVGQGMWEDWAHGIRVEEEVEVEEDMEQLVDRAPTAAEWARLAVMAAEPPIVWCPYIYNNLHT